MTNQWLIAFDILYKSFITFKMQSDETPNSNINSVSSQM